MKIAEFEILSLENGKIEIYLRVFDFELSGNPTFSFADVVDNLKIINPVQGEIDWEKLTSKKKE